MWALKNKQPGFTIVELLIVIVVIGILAAITIVAFNGVTTKAENTKTVSGVESYAKLIRSYAAEKGQYPVTGYACLGPLGTRCANTDDGTAACFGAGGASAQSSLLNAIATVSSSIPQVSAQTMNCGGKQYGGAWYYSPDGITTQLVYYLKGDQPCVSTSGLQLGSRQQQDDTTVCRMTFPSP